jgi:predicted ATPase
VVCLDDLQWADEGSLRLLHAALTVVGDVPMLLAGARRMDVVDGALAGAELLAALPAAVSRIAVEPLTLGQVDELVTALVGGPLPATVLTRVAERTGGNAFLVQEVATLLAESPAALDTAVPAGVHDLLGRRLARLPAGCLEVLAVLSVLGGEAQIDELAAVYGDTDVAVRGELDPAVRAGLVRLRVGARRGRRERLEEWLRRSAAAGVESAPAGPGSDFSEAPASGFEPAALEPVAAPACPPGPATISFPRRRFWSLTSWR